MLPLENPSFIVATWHEGNPPLEAREVLGAFSLPAQGEITQVIDGIVGSYNLVPVLDECRVQTPSCGNVGIAERYSVLIDTWVRRSAAIDTSQF